MRSYLKPAPSTGRDGEFLIAAGAILALGAALRFYGITRESAWADELWTLLIADPTLSFGEFWERVLADVHPPLYYLLMRGWSAVFGQSDLAARLPSVIFGILMVAVGGLAPLPRAGRLTLMALLAISPGAIEYAQEARSYALLLLLSTVIALACVAIVGKPERERPLALVRLTLAAILASFTHYFGALFAIGAAVVAAALGRSRRAALAAAVIAASIAPWVIYHPRYMSSGAPLAAWMADFPLAATGTWFVRLWLGDNWGLLALGLLVAGLLAMPKFRGLARKNVALLVGVSLALLTVTAAWALSWWAPVLSARNLAVVIPALYLAIAAFAADAMRVSRAAGIAGIAVLLLLMLPRLERYYFTQTKEEWRKSAAFVVAQPGCVTGPLHVYGDSSIYRYLVGKARPELQLIEIPLGKAADVKSQPAGDCPVALWAGRISPEDFAEEVLAVLPPREPACRQVTEFYWASVVTRDPTDPACRQIP